MDPTIEPLCVFLKKASLAGDFTRALGSPWMAFAVVLNLYQIVFVTYVFAAARAKPRIGRVQLLTGVSIDINGGVFFS